MDALVGRTVLETRRSADGEVLSFVTDNGSVTYMAYGDCCSESWFQHVSGLEYLVGATVTTVEELPEREAEGTKQDVDMVYGWHVHTSKGTCQIEMRNSSNGHYGGSADEEASATELATILVTQDF